MENKTPELPAVAEIAEKAFGLNVRSLRLSAGMTQSDLAARITSMGVSMRQTMVAKIERGARPTPVGEVAILSSIFGVPPAVLLAAADTVPDSVAALLDMRMGAMQTASLIDELLEQSQHIEQRLENQRSLLVSKIRTYDKTLAAVLDDEGEEWLASHGITATPLGVQDPRFIALGSHEHAPLNEGIHPRNVNMDRATS